MARSSPSAATAALVVTQLGLQPLAVAARCALASASSCGAIVERLVVRPLYARPLDAILATWGLGIIIGQLITLGFGREVQFVQSPITGTVGLLGETYSEYRLHPGRWRPSRSAARMARSCTAPASASRRRAVIMNEDLARGLGINSGCVRFVTFCARRRRWPAWPAR